MNIKPASITLTALSEDELKLCLLLLKTPLHNRQKMNALVREIEVYVSTTIPDQWKKRDRSHILGNRLCLLRESVQTKRKQITNKRWMKDLRNDLWNIQLTWRSKVDGPSMLNPEAEGYQEYFDSDALEHHEIKLPLLKFIEQEGSRRILQPLLRIILNDVGDMFDVLLARAIANKQLSRLARCICCDRWELKARAGCRSQVKVEFLKQNKISNYSKWPEFIKRIRHWPALCHRKCCKDRFANVARERSPFKREGFRGLMGAAQMRPKNIPYKTEIFPE